MMTPVILEGTELSRTVTRCFNFLVYCCVRPGSVYRKHHRDRSAGCSAHRYTGCGRKKVILISVILVILINVNKLIAMKEINAL